MVGHAHVTQPLILEDDFRRSPLGDFLNARIRERSRQRSFLINLWVMFQRVALTNQTLVCLRNLERGGWSRTAVFQMDWMRCHYATLAWEIFFNFVMYFSA